MTTYSCKNLRIFVEVKPEPQMTDDLIGRADALRFLLMTATATQPGNLTTRFSSNFPIFALPAYEVVVKPGEVERAVWDAMGWALRHAKQMPGDIIPTYTDGGNSDAETECRRAAARIRSALTATTAADVAGLVEAAKQMSIEYDEVDLGHAEPPSMTAAVSELRAALARMKEAKV